MSGERAGHVAEIARDQGMNPISPARRRDRGTGHSLEELADTVDCGMWMKEADFPVSSATCYLLIICRKRPYRDSGLSITTRWVGIQTVRFRYNIYAVGYARVFCPSSHKSSRRCYGWPPCDAAPDVPPSARPLRGSIFGFTYSLGLPITQRDHGS